MKKLLALFSLWLTVGWVAFGQAVIGSTCTATTANSLTCSAVPAGATIFVAAQNFDNPDTPTLTDNGVGQTVYSGPTPWYSGSAAVQAIWAIKNVSAGTHTLALSWANGNHFADTQAVVVTGADAITPVDVSSAVANGPGTTTCTSVTTSATNELLIAFLGIGGGPTLSPGSGMTAISGMNSGGVYGEYKTAVSAGNNTAGYNTSAGQQTVCALLAVNSGSATPTAHDPTFTPGGTGPTYHFPAGGGTVSIACPDVGTSPLYSTDGSTPSIAYTTPVSITVDGTVLKSKCTGMGFLDSGVTTVTYSVYSRTFYVNKIGGTRYSTNNPTGQCNGLANVAYPGSGVNQNCAYGDIRWLWDDKNTSGALNWAIAGGDTVLVSKDSYRIGYDDAANTTGWCPGYGSGAASCFPSNFPSGTPSNHTRILGANYAACSTSKTYINPASGVPVVRIIADITKTTELFGVFGLLTLFDMGASDYVDVQCIEFDTHNTEHCITHGLTGGGGQPPETPACTATSPYVKIGLLTNYQTTHLKLKDISAHGFSSDAMRGEFGAGIDIQHLYLGFNNGSGWSMSGPFGDHANGANASLSLDQWVVEGSGFVEEYPIVDPFPAIIGFSQGTQSQDADGIAAQEGSSFDVTMTNGLSIYNTEDGIDLLHVDAAGSAKTMLIDSTAVWGNMGGFIKSGVGFHTRTVQNSDLIANCVRMYLPMTGAPATYNKYLQDFCRGGDTTGGAYDGTNTINWYNNLMVGAANTFFDYACGTPDGTGLNAACGGVVFNRKNNIIIGASDANCVGTGFPCEFGGNPNPGMFYWSYLQTSPCCTEVSSSTGDPLYGSVTTSNNIIFNIRNLGTLGTGDVVTSPLLVSQPNVIGFTDETIFDAFNFKPSGGSPARASGATLGSVTTDFLGAARTVPYDMGAVQVTGGTPTAPTPTFSPVAGTYSSTQSVTISDSLGGATICWNTTGSPATNGAGGCTTGTLYSAPVSVSTSETLYAVAGNVDHLDSAVGSAAYVITIPSAAQVTTGGTVSISGAVVIQ